jgi:hypothetical protein
VTSSLRFAVVVGTALAAATLCKPHKAVADSPALGTIAGSVTDAETGAALAGATIIATSRLKRSILPPRASPSPRVRSRRARPSCS